MELDSMLLSQLRAQLLSHCEHVWTVPGPVLVRVRVRLRVRVRVRVRLRVRACVCACACACTRAQTIVGQVLTWLEDHSGTGQHIHIGKCSAEEVSKIIMSRAAAVCGGSRKRCFYIPPVGAGGPVASVRILAAARRSA